MSFGTQTRPPSPRALSRDEAELVGAGDRGRVDLDELAVRVARRPAGRRRAAAVPVLMTLLVDVPKMMPRPPVARHTASPGNALDLPSIFRSCATMPTHDAVVVEHGREEVPELELADHLLAGDRDAVLVLDVDRLVAAHLLVERVEELLAGGRAGEGGAVEERAAEAAEVEQPLGRAVERHAHAVEHVDDARRRVGHALDGRLVGEEVAAVGRLFEVHLRASRPRPSC